MELTLGTITVKEIVAVGAFVFMAGGQWRDIRAMRRSLDADRKALNSLIVTHNRNHGDCMMPPMNGDSDRRELQDRRSLFAS